MRKIVKEGLRVLRKEGLSAFVKKARAYIFRFLVSQIGYVLIPFIVRRFRRLVNNVSIDETVDFAFSFNYLGVSIQANGPREEIVSLFRLVERLKPSLFLK